MLSSIPGMPSSKEWLPQVAMQVVKFRVVSGCVWQGQAKTFMETTLKPFAVDQPADAIWHLKSA